MKKMIQTLIQMILHVKYLATETTIQELKQLTVQFVLENIQKIIVPINNILVQLNITM